VPLLTLYCGHVCNAAEIGALLAKIKPSPGMREDKLRRYQRLLHMREKEARAVSALATRMRITQQAQVHKDVAGRKTEAFVPEAKKPWQG
jgi:hypothetical protein